MIRAQPSPLLRWVAFEPKGPVTWPFALPQPAASRRPSAVLHGSGVARRRARTVARKTARSTDLQFVPPAHLLHRRRARLPQPPPSSPFGIRRGYPFAVIHGAHSGAPVSSARRPSARPASRLLRARLLNEVPGFGAVCSLVRLASLTVARVLPRTSVGGPSRPAVARVPSPLEPARGEPVDRRDFCCCSRADPEGSESPFTPHRVPFRA
jgi:hypothetical protein